jgi:hypothetical protein
MVNRAPLHGPIMSERSAAGRRSTARRISAEVTIDESKMSISSMRNVADTTFRVKGPMDIRAPTREQPALNCPCAGCVGE